jgi:hypothetical protein
MSHEKFKNCIDACLACAIQCEHCGTECLKEEDVGMMAQCILLDRECAEACYATARLLSIGGDHATLFCNACAEICEACAAECAQHDADHCKRCAEECRKCAEECRSMAGQLA